MRIRLTGRKESRWRWLRPWAVVAVLVIVALAIIFRNHLPSVENAGYPGIFLLNLISSGGLVLPVPSLASVCVGASVLNLNPLAIGLVAATGESIGELTGYLAGVSGRNFVEKMPLHKRLMPLVDKHGGLVLFLFALIPNPLFDVVGILAGSLEYPVRRFVAIAFAGKLLKNTIVALGCAYGIEAVLRFF